MKNIRIYSADAFDSGAEGYMNTDWGDYGHYQCYGFSFLGYLYGAECSWNIHRDDNTDVFWNECKKLLFADDNVANAFKSLMDSNLAENIQVGFKTMSAYAFFDDMLTGLSLKGNEKYPAVSLNAFKTLKAKGEEDKAVHMIEQLFDYYMRHPGALPQQFKNALENSDTCREQIVCDYIAGMTDPYAVKKFQDLFVPEAWKV